MREYRGLEDTELMRRIARSGTDALDELYERYSRLVFSLAMNVLGDRDSAEEVLQDVFLSVWNNAGSFRSERAKVSTWLASIARNRAIDLLRGRSSRPKSISLTWEVASRSEDTGVNDPETEVEVQHTRQRVQKAIATLPTEQKEVLALAYFVGYSHRQIAEHTGLSLGTVKTRIRLAMQKLRRLLADEKL